MAFGDCVLWRDIAYFHCKIIREKEALHWGDSKEELREQFNLVSKQNSHENSTNTPEGDSMALGNPQGEVGDNIVESGENIIEAVEGAEGQKTQSTTPSEASTFGGGFEGSSAAEHLGKRQREGHYLSLTPMQYESRALEVLQSDLGGNIQGFETKHGKLVRWDSSTNDFAVGVPNKKVLSMFPLDGNSQSDHQARFDYLQGRDGKGGNP